MPRNSIILQSVFIFLLIFGQEYCDSMTGNYAHESPESPPGKDGYAFFALRSCHQVMRGDTGEFFSPDYLCSNPPLWCNWTIQVAPGKRVRLYLEDFTPGDACHLKLDQVHLDGVSGGHGVLEKCWQEAKYTSLSNTLHVVVLIGGSPVPPHRGFYGRYQSFRPPTAYKSHDHDADGDAEPRVTEPPAAQRSFTKYAPLTEGEPADAVLLERPNYDAAYDYYGQPVSASNELPLEAEEPMRREGTYRAPPVQRETELRSAARSDAAAAVDELRLEDGWTADATGNHSGRADPASFLSSAPSMPAPTRGTGRSGRGGTTRSGRGAAHTLTPPSHEGDLQSASSPGGSSGAPDPSAQQAAPDPGPPRHTSSAVRRNLDARSQEPRGATVLAAASYHDESRVTGAGPDVPHPVSTLAADDDDDDDVIETLVNMTTDELSRPVDTPAPSQTQWTTVDPLPDMEDSLSDSRESPRNHTEVPHLPGGHLFEVAVELAFSSEDDSEELWDHLARSLLMSTKTLIYEQLEILSLPITMLSKRIKRLSAGVLYILWLQIGEGSEGLTVHRTLHAALQGLISTNLRLSGSPRQAVVVSVSTTDVNECGTQLVLCDVNAECVNRFGSYSCHCRPGFEDVSRLGTGGTACVDLKAAGTDRRSQEEMIMVHSPEQQRQNTGCSTLSSPEALRGVYAVCFLLGFLLLLLLTAVGVLYHRRHRGAFLVRCQSSSFGSAPPTPAHNEDNNNNGGGDDGSVHTQPELPPPPPPIRRPREGWSHPKDCCPAVDLPLLHFSPLLPLDGYIEPRERAKM